MKKKLALKFKKEKNNTDNLTWFYHQAKTKTKNAFFTLYKHRKCKVAIFCILNQIYVESATTTSHKIFFTCIKKFLMHYFWSFQNFHRLWNSIKEYLIYYCFIKFYSLKINFKSLYEEKLLICISNFFSIGQNQTHVKFHI